MGKKKQVEWKSSIPSSEVANRLIYNSLLSDESLMIARLGAVELECLANYYGIKNHKNHYYKYIQGKIHHFWWDKNTLSLMSNNAGFFPSTPEMLEKFAELMIEEMPCVDILGSWLDKENFFKEQLTHAEKVDLFDLEPYRHKNPWSAALEGKNVLVIHPFEESIKHQYSQRELLFADKKILPAFKLKTIKAVQTIANNPSDFKDWFEALDYMKDKVSMTDFDIAIIGCGAYGFPLAAHVKRLGKKAIHLGGATQVLFGIIGKRWEEEEEQDVVRQLINNNWIRAAKSEIPIGNEMVEGACYW